MIGVISDPSEHDVVREFFELFKTPWEFYRRDRRYDVLLCAGDQQFEGTASLVLVYAGRRVHFDEDHKIQTGRQRTQCMLSYQARALPVYGDAITFPENPNGVLRDEVSRESAICVDRSEQRVLARIGYDLFGEIRSLLTSGQPSAHASIPTLELHIGLLRDLITGCGVSLIEIPPVPDGYAFVACLTHDVDHPSVRPHKWDHTMFGFLQRALIGSLRHVIRGRMPVQNLFRNWAAALKLPFVYLGIAKDFWREFDNRYLELEEGLRSTFFVIPFKNRPGKNSDSRARQFRAARYGAADIADTIRKLMIAGCEVGLHGIDAWIDSAQGCAELAEIRRLTGVPEVGVRMHWLYYNGQSPAVLETAGASYDSTVGYNETVGYRCGTTQAYKPLQASRLLELPLHVMDTALFYADYLDLSPKEAAALLERLVENAVRLGGCITINWHDRSMAPDRLWETSYCDLLQKLKSQGVWFSTAGQAVSWFRKRRSVVFETDLQRDTVRAKVPGDAAGDKWESLPALRLRIHNAREFRGTGSQGFEGYVDIPFDESVDAQIPCGVSS